MKQSFIFSIIAGFHVVMALVGYLSGARFALESFPDLDEAGLFAVVINQELMAMFLLIIALALYATRKVSGVAGAFALGFLLLGLNSLKHIFIDGVNVPIFAVVLQMAFTAACAYLWFTERNTVSAATS